MADKKIKVIVNSGSHEGVRRGEETEVTAAMMEKFPGKFTPVADLKAAEAAQDLQAALNDANVTIKSLEKELADAKKVDISKFENDLKAATEKVTKLEAELKDSKANVKDLEKANTDLQKQLTAATKQ